MTTVLDSYFEVTSRGSTIAREVRGGLVTFLAMAYIIVLNPIILAGVPDADGSYLGGGSEPGSGFAAIAAATALVAGVLTLLMGVVANFPLALATGLGLNAFVAYSVASQMTWADAMGLVVLEGLIIGGLVLTGFRKAVFDAVPRQLKTAIAVGIGLFITFIGLVDAGFVRTSGVAAPPVGLGIGGQLSGWPVFVFCVGLLLMLVLYARGVPGAILLGIVATTVLAGVVQALTDTPAGEGDPTSTGWNLTVPAWPDSLVATPDFSLLGQFSLLGSVGDVGVVTVALLVFTLLLADFFDTMGTMRRSAPRRDSTTPTALPVGRSGSSWWTRWRRRRGARRESPPTPPTSSPPPGSATEPGPAWPAWSPGCASCCRPSWRPWCRASPTRRRCRLWCWWAS